MTAWQAMDRIRCTQEQNRSSRQVEIYRILQGGRPNPFESPSVFLLCEGFVPSSRGKAPDVLIINHLYEAGESADEAVALGLISSTVLLVAETIEYWGLRRPGTRVKLRWPKKNRRGKPRYPNTRSVIPVPRRIVGSWRRRNPLCGDVLGSVLLGSNPRTARNIARRR